jgi:glutaredoxin
MIGGATEEARMEATVKLFWQPGCTSCLRTKEFLTRRGVPFQSINVHDDPGGWEELQKLGPRTVPVVAIGERFVFAQVLEDVAKFIGIELRQERLAPRELVAKLDDILTAAQEGIRRIPDASLGRKLPGRDRTYRQLGHHIFRIPDAFLEAMAGAVLSADRTNLEPPEAMQTAAAIAAYGADVQLRVRQWWQGTDDRDGAREIVTYYGTKPTQLVLERTTWHSAQHTRQLEMVLGILELGVPRPMSPALLKGLPLPEQVWG